MAPRISGMSAITQSQIKGAEMPAETIYETPLIWGDTTCYLTANALERKVESVRKDPQFEDASTDDAKAHDLIEAFGDYGIYRGHCFLSDPAQRETFWLLKASENGEYDLIGESGEIGNIVGPYGWSSITEREAMEELIEMIK